MPVFKQLLGRSSEKKEPFPSLTALEWKARNDTPVNRTEASSTCQFDRNHSTTTIPQTQNYPFGLFEIVSGGEQPKFDIVAVHGLGGHREKSWTDESTHSMWLRDFLQEDLPQARILTFGYDSATTKLAGQSSTLFLREHAQSMIQGLINVRQDRKRPIMFIGHSLGGIVIKHALILCDQARRGHNQERRSIKASTFAVLTFGTPHGGANGVGMKKAVANVSRAVMSGNTQILSSLKRGSEHLWQLNGEYLPISQDFKSVFFIEQYPLSLGFMVVDRESATLPIKDSISVSLHKNHVTLVKFSSFADPDYQMVLNIICAAVRDDMVFFSKKGWARENRFQGDSR